MRLGSILKKIIFFTMITLLLISCGNKKTEEKILTVAQSGNPRSLDVHNANDGFSLLINKQIYSRLVEADGNKNIVPGLAESWEKINPTTYDFKIRKNIKFHNGDPLKLEDIKFSFERMLKSPKISFIVPPIEKIEIIQPSTIRIITKIPFGPFLAHLAHPALGIVSKKVIESANNQDIPIVGTGPYKLNSWELGNQVVLDRNDNYFLPPVKFDKLIFKNIPEPTSREIALETKEVDIAFEISTIDAEKIKENKDLKLYSKSSYSYRYLAFNNKETIFKDYNLRKAIDYAIDKEALVKIVLNGYGNVANSVIAPTVFGFTNSVKNVGYNLEKAKQYMNKSKYANSHLTLRLLTMGIGEQKTIAEVIQANLKEIGIDVKINIVEDGAFYDMTEKGDFDMFLGSWGTVTGDADYGLYALFHTNSIGSPGNRSFYSNSEVDKLLDEAKTTVNQEKRKELYKKIQEIIVYDTPHIMLFNTVSLVGAQKNIKGLNVHPIAALTDFYPVYNSDYK